MGWAEVVEWRYEWVKWSAVVGQARIGHGPSSQEQLQMEPGFFLQLIGTHLWRGFQLSSLLVLALA